MFDTLPFDWYGAGYDAFAHATVASEERADWAQIRDCIAHARRGDFGPVGSVARELVARTSDPVLHSVACDVVADAGDAAALEVLVLALSSASFDQGLDIAHALLARGRLVDVPAVFSFYEENRAHPDCDAIPAHLNWLLAPNEDAYSYPDESTWEEYRATIAGRYFELWHAHGTNLMHVRHGCALDLGRLVRDMLADLREGVLDGSDRRAFEVMTGRSCSAWFTEMQVKFLTVAADLEAFIASGGPDRHPPGQRAFMGHALEDVRAAARVFAAYPQNRGLEVPEIRTAFEVDAYFALPFGFEPFHGGYFVRSTKPPPSAEWLVDADWPWLSLHMGLRAAMAGDRSLLPALASWIGADTEPVFRSAVIHLVARAANDLVLEPWRDAIRAFEDPDFTLALCEGLLRRGVLRDIPLVLDAYRRKADAPDYAHLQDRFNLLLALWPAHQETREPMAVADFCAIVMRRVEQLRQAIGRDDVPIFRGALFDVIAVARELAGQTSPVTFDLRERFEGSTGIDCTVWEVPGPFDPENAFDPRKAAASARNFLASEAAKGYRPGELYFFGQPVDAPTDGP